MAQEPLGFRCWGFSPQYARTHSGILTSLRSTGRFHARFPAEENAPLPLMLFVMKTIKATRRRAA
jgi:hypothetical protein